MNYTEFFRELLEKDPYIDQVEVDDRGANIPIYWSVDGSGNINFDIESIRQQFETLIDCLENHNDSTEFDWDNC